MAKRCTPFDSETVVMLEGLTQKRSFITGFDDYFTIHAIYERTDAPEFLNAVINAVRGRMGDRFIEVNDDTDNCVLRFAIKYDEHEYPTQMGEYYGSKDLRFADSYSNGTKDVIALQVHRTNSDKLRKFVGGGKLITERCPNGRCWFEFLNNGVFCNVKEGDYIVLLEQDRGYSIWNKKEFEKVFEKKHIAERPN